MITNYQEIEINLTVHGRDLSADLRGPEGIHLVRPISVDMDIHESELIALGLGLKSGQEASELGHRLYTSLFREELRERFIECLSRFKDKPKMGLRVRFNTEAEALNLIPFELLCRQTHPTVEFMALDDKTPIVRSPRSGRASDRRAISFPLRMLVVYAAPRFYKKVDIAAVKALEVLQQAGRLTVDMEPHTSYQTLQDTLVKAEAPYDIIHFVVHGALADGYDPHRAEGILLFVEPETGRRQDVSATNLAELIANKGVRFVMLQTCESGRAEVRNAFAGVAQRFSAVGIPAVVGMQHAIDVDVANVFVDCLYHSWLSGTMLPLERAVTEARRTVKATFKNHPVAWATPVLCIRCSSSEVLGTTLISEIENLDKRTNAERDRTEHSTATTINIGYVNQVIGSVTGDMIVPIEKTRRQKSMFPILTIGQVYNLSPSERADLKEQFCQCIGLDTDSQQDLLSYSLLLLESGLYKDSQTLLAQVTNRNPLDAYGWYALSIANLEGNRPRDLTRLGEARKAHDPAYKAYKLDPTQAHFALLLAAIKEDFFEYRRLGVNSPSVMQCLESADRGSTSLKELDALVKILNLPGGKVIKKAHEIRLRIAHEK